MRGDQGDGHEGERNLLGFSPVPNKFVAFRRSGCNPRTCVHGLCRNMLLSFGLHLAHTTDFVSFSQQVCSV